MGRRQGKGNDTTQGSEMINPTTRSLTRGHEPRKRSASSHSSSHVKQDADEPDTGRTPNGTTRALAGTEKVAPDTERESAKDHLRLPQPLSGYCKSA